jgi:hypothetical protein
MEYVTKWTWLLESNNGLTRRNNSFKEKQMESPETASKHQLLQNSFSDVCRHCMYRIGLIPFYISNLYRWEPTPRINQSSLPSSVFLIKQKFLQKNLQHSRIIGCNFSIFLYLIVDESDSSLPVVFDVTSCFEAVIKSSFQIMVTSSLHSTSALCFRSNNLKQVFLWNPW